AAMSEENMSKEELLTTINSLLTSINISDRSKYYGLCQKNCNKLREILQTIRNLQDNQNELDESESEN
ncbi:15967_t:CDS:1, partial [Gigaspora margarita]